MNSHVPVDPYELDRFVQAQDDDYERAIQEIKAGRKESHWMWYIFPQFAGLGSSSMAIRYAIKSMAEAKAYLSHPIVGPRLAECFDALCRVEGRSANEIFGSPDDLKLRSCATLFAECSPPDSLSARILEKYFNGQRDERTIELLAKQS
jgi:uncharacterized protein (DUF1810 family)